MLAVPVYALLIIRPLERAGRCFLSFECRRAQQDSQGHEWRVSLVVGTAHGDLIDALAFEAE